MSLVDWISGATGQLKGAKALFLSGMGLACALTAHPAEAAVFSTAKTLAPRTLMIGVEPQVVPAAGPAYEFFLHGGFGMTGAADLQMKVGLPIQDGAPIYVGGDVQFSLLRDQKGAPGISLSVGAHGRGRSSFGLDSTLILSNDFGKVEPYLAVDGNFEFQGNQIDPRFHVVPGISVDISNPTRFFFELGLPVGQGALTYVSAGFQFVF